MTSSSSESLGLSQDSEGIDGPFLINTPGNTAIQMQLVVEQNAARWDEALARPLASTSPSLPNSFSQSVLDSDLTVRRPLTSAIPIPSSQPQFRTPVHNPYTGPFITPSSPNAVRSPFVDLVPLPQLFDQSSVQVPATTSFARPNSFQIPSQEMDFTFDFTQPLANIPQYTGYTSNGALGRNRDSDSLNSNSNIVEITTTELTPRVHTSFRSLNSAHQHMGPELANLSQIPPMQSLSNEFCTMPGAWPGLTPDLIPLLPAQEGTRTELANDVNTFVTSYCSLNQNGSMLNNGCSAAPNSGAYHQSEPQPSHEHHLGYLYADSKKSGEEITKLLENIRPDEYLPPHLREGTPDSMRLPLLEHQKLGLAWLKQQEEGSNKAGILADDMGLGKIIRQL